MPRLIANQVASQSYDTDCCYRRFQFKNLYFTVLRIRQAGKLFLQPQGLAERYWCICIRHIRRVQMQIRLGRLLPLTHCQEIQSNLTDVLPYFVCSYPYLLNILKMILEKVISAVLLLSICTSINIPLSPMRSRCMIGYTSDSDENLKMDVTFPMIPGQKASQNYQISIENTESGQTTNEIISNGVFKKEIPMEENVIYRFCFRVLTNRQIGTVLIDYNSELKFRRHGSTAQVPENLLKIDDLKETYDDALEMEDVIKSYKEAQERKKNHQFEEYDKNLQNTERLLLISYVEIAVIVLTGIYQFFAVRKFLIDKQYL